MGRVVDVTYGTFTFEIPKHPSASWSMPGHGGPVLIRGYDTYRSHPHDLLGADGKPVWGIYLDEAIVPTQPSTAAKCTALSDECMKVTLSSTWAWRRVVDPGPLSGSPSESFR